MGSVRDLTTTLNTKRYFPALVMLSCVNDSLPSSRGSKVLDIISSNSGLSVLYNESCCISSTSDAFTMESARSVSGCFSTATSNENEETRSSDVAKTVDDCFKRDSEGTVDAVRIILDTFVIVMSDSVSSK